MVVRDTLSAAAGEPSLSCAHGEQDEIDELDQHDGWGPIRLRKSNPPDAHDSMHALAAEPASECVELTREDADADDSRH